MKLQIKNIGMIKEATIKLDGLTVIAGENDSGKSTIGKSLVTLLKTEFTARQKYFKKKKEQKENLKRYYFNNRKYGFERLQEILFENFLRSNYDLYPESFNDKNYIKLELEKAKYIEVYFNKEKNQWEFDKNKWQRKISSNTIQFGLEYFKEQKIVSDVKTNDIEWFKKQYLINKTNLYEETK